jgi:acetoin utilization protein AcuC
MRFTAESHGRAARDLASLAEELGHGRVLGTGGGGYNRINLAQAWTAVVQGFVDTPHPAPTRHIQYNSRPPEVDP